MRLRTGRPSGPAAQGRLSVFGDGRTSGREPDYRFTLANERTFLAWNQVSLGLVVAGVVLTHLLTDRSLNDWLARLVGVGLVAPGGILAATSLIQLRSNQGAIRAGAPLPRSRLPAILTGAVVSVSVLAVVVLLLLET